MPVSINNPEAFANSQPNWDSIFPRPVTNKAWRLSDMDGFGERNGQFLFIEWKSPGVEIDWTKGQGFALMRLAHTDHCSVLVLWGTAPDGPVVAYQRPKLDTESHQVADREHIKVYEAWYKRADNL